MKRTLSDPIVSLLSFLAVSALFLLPFTTEVHAGAASPGRQARAVQSFAQAGTTTPQNGAPAKEQAAPSEAKPAPGEVHPEAGKAPAEVAPAGAKPTAPAETPAPPAAKPEEAKQPQAAPQQPSRPFPSVMQRREAAGRAAYQAGGGPVSFFFDDADVFEVVQTVFGDVLKVNYIIDQRVKGKVTFRTVTPIPKDEVLPVIDIILRLNGIGYVEEKGLYRIVPLTEVPKELVYAQVGKDPGKVAIELFSFKNTNLKESMSDIENAIGLNVQGGTVRILPIWRLNALLVIASSKEQMEYVRKWIEAFDNMFAYARPRIIVYPLQNSKAAHVASMLQSILGGGTGGGGGAAVTSAPSSAPKPPAPATGSAGAPPAATKTGPAATVSGGAGFLVSPETKIFADEIANSLVVLATPADYGFIEETIKKIDTVPRQVVIEGLLVRVDLTDNLDFGMQWTIQNNFTIKGFKPFNRDINIQGPLTLNTPITNPTFTFTAYDAAGNVKLLLQALATQGKAKILASPHILVSDNREARIQVGQQIPIATSTTTQPLGVTTPTVPTVASTSTIQYKDIGIILKVKPQINDSGLVSLEVTQEVSSLGANVPIAGQDFASINKTEATTNLVAQDGETIIIGGLIREDSSKSRSGIPFLSRIPLLGYLFGSTIDETTRSELIILLTPHVVRNMQEAGDVTTDYVEKYKGVTKDKSIEQFLQERSQQGRKGKNGGGQSGQ